MSGAGAREQRLAFFISPHGFGHAARAAAVMAAVQEKRPATQFEIFTRVPAWFFQDSMAVDFAYHSLLTDIGLAQKTSLVEDLDATLESLAAWWPLDEDGVCALAKQVRQSHCELIVCDISPLGLAVARTAGIPAVLVENFTWDWIYEGYAEREPRFARYTVALREIFATATFHIQTEPVCQPRRVDLTTAPVSRRPRAAREQVREKIRVPPHARAVLITMGGIAGQYSFFEKLTRARGDIYFIIPGASESIEHIQNLVLLPHHSGFYHPDLINACDAVIGKLGYSTLAETYYAGIPFGYVARPGFRESQVLANFAQRRMAGVEVPAGEFESGQWVDRLPELFAVPRVRREEGNGAVQAADFICHLLESSED